MADSFFFYDLETSGRDPRWHRIIQFAGVRTDADFVPMGEPLSWRVVLDDDVVPEPEAALVTGMVPADSLDGLDDAQNMRRIAAEFSQPRTCVTGYNSLRFDDEFVRYGFWRNLHDPYAREWQGGNSRWDLIDLARLAAALRPEGMQWPVLDGRRSFRLEALASANGIEQLHAHDAVSDVLATLGLARCLKAAQPRLFDWYLSLRDKRAVADVILPVLARPCVHVSSRYGADQSHLALVASVATHPVNRNSVIVADLSVAPELWMDLPADELGKRLFARRDALGDTPRPPLKEVHLNKVPAVAPLGVLRTEDAERLGVDRALCERHLRQLQGAAGLAERIREVYAPRPREAVDDVDGALYDGFLPDADRAQLIALRDADAQTLAAPPPLTDARARELLFRYRARRHPESLDAEERAVWAELVRDRLQHGRPGMDGLDATRARIDALLAEGRDPQVLGRLREHLDGLAARWGLAG
ncbi:MAG TPA: exodeoxyribonuclease I [Pseudomonadales bacterium]|nr:exodeoxyribonuclease I [Pseudomonadales bacterium]